MLESELKKWAELSYAQIVSKLRETEECYEVEVNSTTYQVEIAILERTDSYLHLSISVDDGSLPASLRPASSSFIVHKNPS